MSNNLQSNKDNAIYFIASTLPLKYIEEDKKKKKIIFACGSDLSKSCKSIFKNNKKYTILNISKNKIIQLFQLLFLFAIKYKRYSKIKFFHETSVFIFDLLIIIFKIKSEFIPHVTLKSFVKTDKLPILNVKTILITLLNLKKNFYTLKVPKDNQKGSENIFAVKKYSNNVIVRDNYVIKTLRRNFTSKGLNCLFLVSTDIDKNINLKKIYTLIANVLEKNNFKIYLKNHPRPGARLDLKFKNYEEIDPYLPYEFVKEDFRFLIGCASTSLVNAPKQTTVISILNMLSCTKKEKELRKKHLTALDSEKKIKFINEINDITSFI